MGSFISPNYFHQSELSILMISENQSAVGNVIQHLKTEKPKEKRQIGSVHYQFIVILISDSRAQHLKAKSTNQFSIISRKE